MHYQLLFENPSVKQKEKREKPGLRSKIVIETAMNKEAGRSSTIHNLHVSELAFWPHPEETMTSVMQTVPNEPGTCVIIESTANGVGGLFYEEWQKAERGESPFAVSYTHLDVYKRQVPEPFTPLKAFDMDSDSWRWDLDHGGLPEWIVNRVKESETYKDSLHQEEVTDALLEEPEEMKAF